VKVDGADGDWRAGQAWIEESQAVYDWDSVDALRSMLSGPAWRAPDAET
jgi:hypothetical protein